MIDHTGNQPPSEYLVRWLIDQGLYVHGHDKTERDLLTAAKNKSTAAVERELLCELLDMVDLQGRFLTGVKPGAFTQWLVKTRSRIK